MNYHVTIPVRFVLFLVLKLYLSEATSQLFNLTAIHTATYYVVPSNNNTCPHRDIAPSCHTFEEYVRYGDFSHSNSTFLFLPGVHIMNQSLTVNNTDRLSLKGIGDRNISITCTRWNIGFIFTNMRCLTIQNVQIHNCSQQFLVHETNSSTKVFSALFIQHGYNLTLSAVTLVNGGIFVNNTLGQVTIEESSVISFLSEKEKTYSASFGGSYLNYEICNVSANLTINDSSFEFHNHSSVMWTESHLDVKNRPAGVQLTLYCTNIQVQILNSNFSGYKGLGDGGNMALILQNNLHTYEYPLTVQNCRFEGGYAWQGGGVYISLVQVSVTSFPSFSEAFNKSYNVISFESTTFQNNTAFSVGGAVCIKQKESFTSDSIQLIGFRACDFRDNHLLEIGHGGIAIHVLNFIAIKYLYHPNPQFNTTISDCTFQRNYIRYHSHCSSGNGVVFVTHSSYFMVKNSTLSFNNCTAITAIGTNLIFESSVIISDNRGSSGGGLMFCENSVMFLKPYTNVTITHNAVVHAGGGICVEAQCLQSKPMCFYQLDNKTAHNISLLDTISINLIQNNAINYAGHNLFGGSVDNCYIIDSPDRNAPPIHGLRAFYTIFNFDPPLNESLSVSGVTSIPRRICFCENGTKNCSILNKHVLKYPGEMFSIEAVPVGQLNGNVPGSVHAFNEQEVNCFKFSERIQKISRPKCSILSYTIMSNKSTEKIYLRIQHDGDVSGYERTGFYTALPLEVSLRDCPIGFTLRCKNEQTSCFCDCSDVLVSKQMVSCNIKDQTINRTHGWIGYISDPADSEANDKYFVYKDLCPRHLCKRSVSIKSEILNKSLEEDKQCLYNRTGILCGSCQKNLSMILGTSDCWSCSNKSLALLPLFAIAGILLVFLLTICNVTIAEGSLSGLIFYANVIQIGESSFFRNTNSWLISFLRVFISWINLDFGISACLYDGMDAYAKAWLQFVFPLYIWTLSGLIVYLCHRYIFVTKLVGTNSVKVLATLILLSYTKMIRTIVGTMSFVILKIHSESEVHLIHRFLWMHDPNIPFLLRNSKHIPLFICGLLFSLLCLPFLIFMLLIQHMPKLSKFKGFGWIQRLKPFLDSYTGANTQQGRFWTGLLLLCRTFLSIIANMNIFHGSLIYITYASLTCIVLLLISHCLPSGVYLKHKYNILESFFLVNLTILCIASAYIKANNESIWHQSCFVGILVGLTFLVFIVLLFFHFWKRVKNTSFGTALKLWVIKKVKSDRGFIQNTEDDTGGSIIQFPPVTRFDQYREPLLASGVHHSYH